MSHIFISYARKDGTKFKELLRDQLRKNGFTQWIDTEQILAGDNWPKKIDDALRDSFTLILVLTTGAIESIHVTYEWMFALGRGIRVIPLKCLDLEKEMHPRLKDYSYEEFVDPKHDDWNKLIDLLTKLQREYDAEEFASELPPNTPRFVVNCLNDLETTDERKQRKAVDDLSKSDLEASTKQLARISQSHHLPELRIYAAFKFLEKKREHLATHKKAIISGLSDGLRENNDDIRRRASRELYQLGDDAIPILIEALKYSYSETRYTAVKTLGDLRAGIAVPYIAPLFNDAHDKVVAGAIEALISIGDQSCVELLEPLVSDPRMSDSNLFNIGQFLKEKGRELGKNALLKVMGYGDYNYLAQPAADLLKQLGQDTVIMQECEKILADKKRKLNRLLAADILSRAKYIPALPILVAAIEDTDLYFRTRFIRALTHMGPEPIVIDTLITKLDDPDTETSYVAKSGLQMFNTEVGNAAIEKWGERHKGETNPPVLDI